MSNKMHHIPGGSKPLNNRVLYYIISLKIYICSWKYQNVHVSGLREKELGSMQTMNACYLFPDINQAEVLFEKESSFNTQLHKLPLAVFVFKTNSILFSHFSHFFVLIFCHVPHDPLRHSHSKSVYQLMPNYLLTQHRIYSIFVLNSG